MKIRFLIFLVLVLMTGCVLGPNYKRPAAQLPAQYHGAAHGSSDESIADKKWADLFHDDALKTIIETALSQNFDLAIAAERVEESRARFGSARADQIPSVSLGAQETTSRPSLVGATKIAPGTPSLDSTYIQGGGLLSWELDLWGRLRRATESAKAQFIASEEGKRGVTVSLISDAASNYFTLRERDLELEIARNTLKIAEDNLRLVKLRHDFGAASGLDVYQAETLLYTASGQISRNESDISESENALSLLLAKAPGDIPRGNNLNDFHFPETLSPGLPSALLARRPDIRQAEQNLIAANAQIGAARAAYFPQITLTGYYEGQSRALTELLTGPARYVNGTTAALVPIFSRGQIRGKVRLSEAQMREMALFYRKTIYNALREVSNALIRYDKTGEQLKKQEMLVQALSETDRLSNMRYRGGRDSYLQVLDAERNLFQGQLTLARLRLQGMLSYVELYRALGGGWQ